LNDENLNSVVIARMINRPHKSILGKIKNSMSKLNNVDIEDYFIKHTYKDRKNETRPCFLVTLKGIKYFIDDSRKQLNLISLIEWYNEKNVKTETIILQNRPEIMFLDKLEETLSPMNIMGERQYISLKYRIDYYIKDLNIAIEYDEGDHEQYTYEQQELRQALIEKELRCRFIRVSDKNSDEYNIGLVFKELFQIACQYIIN
jgi:very-short-patch-repair endonuclease